MDSTTKAPLPKHEKVTNATSDSNISRNNTKIGLFRSIKNKFLTLLERTRMRFSTLDTILFSIFKPSLSKWAHAPIGLLTKNITLAASPGKVNTTPKASSLKLIEKWIFREAAKMGHCLLNDPRMSTAHPNIRTALRDLREDRHTDASLATFLRICITSYKDILSTQDKTTLNMSASAEHLNSIMSKIAFVKSADNKIETWQKEPPAASSPNQEVFANPGSLKRALADTRLAAKDAVSKHEQQNNEIQCMALRREAALYDISKSCLHLENNGNDSLSADTVDQIENLRDKKRSFLIESLKYNTQTSASVLRGDLDVIEAVLFPNERIDKSAIHSSILRAMHSVADQLKTTKINASWKSPLIQTKTWQDSYLHDLWKEYSKSKKIDPVLAETFSKQVVSNALVACKSFAQKVANLRDADMTYPNQLIQKINNISISAEQIEKWMFDK